MAADAAVSCANRQFVSSDPRSFCAVRCKSASPASDVVVQVDQTSVPHGSGDGPVPSFVVRIVQTVPAVCDQTFSNVQTLWSGDFMNFSGQNGQWQFHLLPSQSASSPYGGIDNVEVYALDGSVESGPVYVELDERRSGLSDIYQLKDYCSTSFTRRVSCSIEKGLARNSMPFSKMP